PQRESIGPVLHESCSLMNRYILLIVFGSSFSLCGTIGNSLPVFGTLDSFSLQTQDRNAFTANDLQGHVTIVNFILTSCQGPCPLLSQQMSAIQKKTEKFGAQVK